MTRIAMYAGFGLGVNHPAAAGLKSALILVRQPTAEAAGRFVPDERTSHQ